MKQIKCPKCGEVFQVDETGYAQIVKQVRDSEFAADIERRECELREQAGRELELVRAEERRVRGEAMAEKDAALRDKQLVIEQLRAKLSAGETEKQLAVTEALTQARQQLEQSRARITELDAKLSAGETEKQLAVAEAVKQKDRELFERSTEITELKSKLRGQEAQSSLEQTSLKEQYEQKLRLKDEQIEYYKDFKARQSTKMVGESLEQHCMTQFNSIRMAAFPNAYFEKDNDARTGSKGDFIFRENAEDGTELISIMFEMKNELDATATKHRNEDFFKELDKDRREKGCEYAVLVSLLEIDSDLYNNGIVDVSYRFDKMYVIRPQFFIPIISLLRNAALNSMKYRRELRAVRDQQLDIIHFEENMNAFKDAFGRNYRLASERFRTAIEEIDKSISHLNKIKEALLASENNLRLANNKAEDLSIKKLTKNAPSVREMFESLGGEEG